MTFIVYMNKSHHNRPHQFVKHLSKKHNITVRSINDWQKVFSRNKVNEIIGKNDFDLYLNYSTLVSGYYAARKLNTVYDFANELGAMIKASPEIPYFIPGAGGMN